MPVFTLHGVRSLVNHLVPIGVAVLVPMYFAIDRDVDRYDPHVVDSSNPPNGIGLDGLDVPKLPWIEPVQQPSATPVVFGPLTDTEYIVVTRTPDEALPLFEPTTLTETEYITVTKTPEALIQAFSPTPREPNLEDLYADNLYIQSVNSFGSWIFNSGILQCVAYFAHLVWMHPVTQALIHNPLTRALTSFGAHIFVVVSNMPDHLPGLVTSSFDLRAAFILLVACTLTWLKYAVFPPGPPPGGRPPPPGGPPPPPPNGPPGPPPPSTHIYPSVSTSPISPTNDVDLGLVSASNGALELDGLRRELNTCNETSESKTQTIGERDATIRKLEAEAQGLQAQRDSALTENTILVASRDSLQGELREAKEALQQRDQASEEAPKIADDLRREGDSLRARNEELEKGEEARARELQEAQSNLATRTSGVEELRRNAPLPPALQSEGADTVALQKKVEGLEASLKEAQEKTPSVKVEPGSPSLEKRYALTARQLKDANEQVNELEQQVVRLKEGAEKEADSKLKAAEDETTALSQAKADSEAAAKKQEETEAELKQLREREDKSEAEIKNLNQQIEDLSKADAEGADALQLERENIAAAAKDALRKAAQEAEEKAERLEKEKEEAEKKTEQANNAISQLHSSLATVESRHGNEIRQKLAEQRVDYEERLRQHIGSLSAENNVLQENLQTASNLLEGAEAEHNRIVEETELEAEANHKRIIEEIKEVHNKELRERIAGLEHNNGAPQTDVENLRERLQNTQRALDQAAKEKTKRDEENNDLALKLMNCEDEEQTLRDTLQLERDLATELDKTEEMDDAEPTTSQPIVQNPPPPPTSGSPERDNNCEYSDDNAQDIIDWCTNGQTVNSSRPTFTGSNPVTPYLPPAQSREQSPSQRVEKRGFGSTKASSDGPVQSQSPTRKFATPRSRRTSPLRNAQNAQENPATPFNFGPPGGLLRNAPQLQPTVGLSSSRPSSPGAVPPVTPVVKSRDQERAERADADRNERKNFLYNDQHREASEKSKRINQEIQTAAQQAPSDNVFRQATQQSRSASRVENAMDTEQATPRGRTRLFNVDFTGGPLTGFSQLNPTAPEIPIDPQLSAGGSHGMGTDQQDQNGNNGAEAEDETMETDDQPQPRFANAEAELAYLRQMEGNENGQFDDMFRGNNYKNPDTWDDANEPIWFDDPDMFGSSPNGP